MRAALAGRLIQTYESGLRRRPVFSHLSNLETSQWWLPDHLEQHRLARLNRLLSHAIETCPWYGDLFKRMELPELPMKSLSELSKWPLMDRKTITANRVAMRSTDPRLRLITKATGGSSGEPLRFDLDTAGNEERMAAWHRGYAWAGAEPGTRQWYLWGVPPESVPAWRRLKQWMYDSMYRRTVFNCFDLSTDRLDEAVSSLSQTKPDVIVAYTGALDAFAQMLEDRKMKPFSPKSIVVGAEKLHPHQRDRIERVFGAPVFETYGSREFTLMASECSSHDGLHLTAENHILEIVDDAGAAVPVGIEGNVVVTDLTNFGMPFVRYLNGDRAVAMAGVCSCGRPLPRLARITGRQLDVLTTPEGHRLPGEFFPHILKEIKSVHRFQVIQEVPDAVTLKLVAPGWADDDVEWLTREMNATAARTLKVNLQIVDDIPLTRSGKLQVVVNRLYQEGESGQ